MTFAAVLLCILAVGEPFCKVETRVVQNSVACKIFVQEVYDKAVHNYPKGTRFAIRGMCLPLPQGQKS